MANETDILLEMYKDSRNRGRYHEDQCSTVTNLVIVLAGAVIGLLSLKEFSHGIWPLPAFLAVLGFFGALFTIKHYERFRYHMKCAKQYREALQKQVPSTDFQLLRETVRKRHKGRYHTVQNIHLYVFWMCPHWTLFLVGLALTALNL